VASLLADDSSFFFFLVEGGDNTEMALKSADLSKNVTLPRSIVSSLLGVDIALEFVLRSTFVLRRGVLRSDCARIGVVILREGPGFGETNLAGAGDVVLALLVSAFD